MFAIAVAVYEVMNADDKLNETGRQLSIGGAGIAGGWAGGALAAWQIGNMWR
ncbi:hypothetical protein [Brenneria tiliae]|uniref:hypothetical protein n=1 Tax=Brenneria tiliae TaxID=2914984 RepID=UPI0020148D2A|nr:hypothetical protein [Brenneria tiliae]MCL2896121.1 hypothetical protein [Brenneria tiliae]MCL2900684.1 hypothetical protein [Brenneria tiliae]